MVDKICEKLGEWFEPPCQYAFGEDAFDGDAWCEEHCGEELYGACWKRFFERELEE